MKNIPKKIEELRTMKGLTRVQLSAELGYPKMQVEKFETGRVTPSKQQLKQIADYFEVTTAYLTGEDDSFMAAWMADTGSETVEPVYHAAPKPQPKPKKETKPDPDNSNVFAAFLKSEAFKQAVLEVLKTPEGQNLVRKIINKQI